MIKALEAQGIDAQVVVGTRAGVEFGTWRVSTDPNFFEDRHRAILEDERAVAAILPELKEKLARARALAR